MQYICENKEELIKVAEIILQEYPDKRVFALHAEMGTGKTTFMQAVCHCLQSEDHATSPTFAIVNEYALPKGGKMYHMDCYRLNNLEEALEIGMDTYLEEGRYCFIEWPDIIAPLLPEDTIHIFIETESPYSGGKRIFRF